MTDDEFAAMMQKLGPAGAGLQSPSQITATGAKVLAGMTANPPAIPSLESPQFAISNAPTGTPGAGRDTLNRFATDAPASKGTTGAIMSVLAPDRPQETIDSSGLNKAIDKAMEWHLTDPKNPNSYANQKEDLGKAIATLGNLDATDTEKDKAHETIQNIPTKLNELTGNLDVVSPVPTQSSVADLFKAHGIPATEGNIRQGQRDLFVSNITPAQTAEGATASRFANLNVGPSARALQDLGIQFPGTTGKYQGGSPIATAPIFKPDAPPPPQKIERAQPVPGQTVDAQGNVAKAPASSIGLTTVRGTEFGQVDNPARGGYTEANWNVGAWGADISDTKTPMVALPVKVLSQYGNPNSGNYAKEFNSKYEVQVTDPATGKVVVASLGDKGPGASTGAGLDMTWATREQLGLKQGFSGNMAYRVVPKGSPLPDNTTQSVQQTTANAGGTTDQHFTPGPVADQIHVNRIDPSTIKDPTVHGSTMTTAEIALWARNQANEYADQMTQAGMPIRMDAYQAQYQKFFEAGQKYQNPEEKLAPVSPQHNQQFSSLAALVSPDATSVGSQLDALEKYWKGAHAKVAWDEAKPEQFRSDERKIFESQSEHLLSPIATGIMGMSVGDAGNVNVQEGMKKVLPNMWDSTEVAQQKIANLRSSVQDQMRRMIQLNKAEHQDTTGLEQQYRRLFVQSKEDAKVQQAKSTQSTSAVLDANQPGQKKNQVPSRPPDF